MANSWFRLYSEFSHDPKIQMMSECDQRRFVMLLCMRCGNNNVTLHDETVAFHLRISNEEWVRSKALFLSKNLIDEDNNPVAWDKRQFASDSSAARVAKHREKNKQTCNVTVTPPDTDTDTELTKDKSLVVVGKPKTEIPDCPHSKLLALYAEILPEMPQPRVWDGARMSNMRARWRWVMTAKKKSGERHAEDEAQALEFFRRFFTYVSKSDFLTGRNGQWTGCALAWLVKAENFAKVLEGNYENKEAA